MGVPTINLKELAVLFVLVWTVGAENPAYADVDFMVAEQWPTLSDNAKQYYIGGVVDGWNNILKLKGTSPTDRLYYIYEPILNCVDQRKMSARQLVAIVDKYIADRPDQWHFAFSSLVWSALRGSCSPS